jgi:hypothetical protein
MSSYDNLRIFENYLNEMAMIADLIIFSELDSILAVTTY